MKKLTLSADEAVIQQAKDIAEERGTSVSAMFENFIRLLALKRRAKNAIGPITRRASGIARLPKNKSERDLLEDALMEKHGFVDKKRIPIGRHSREGGNPS